jgi:alginate O-acetyltransferase complex protein AlgI
VFIFSGLWHGAAWTFVFWGAYHGFFLVIERMFLLKLYKRIPKLIQVGITFLIVVFGWVFFRAADFSTALLIIKNMLFFSPQWIVFTDPVKLALAVAALFAFFGLLPKVESWQNKMLFESPTMMRSLLMGISTIVLLVVSISVIAASDFNPFIYFRF